MLSLKLYYAIKPLIPRQIQLKLRRLMIRSMLPSCKDVWPICQKAGNAPEGWAGWPEGKQFAVVLTHDVDTARGHEKCSRLVQIEEELDFRSALYFVPERYSVSADLRHDLTSRGFEIGVHGLNHDGKLYESKEEFQRRAARINRYLEQWQCSGFRSPAMHHNLDWLGLLDIEYDASTFDTDPFEPQPGGMQTIFPFWVPRKEGTDGYIELPYTMPQDSTLFVLMREEGIDIWRKKLNWIAKYGGMALLITHPDYMDFEGRSERETYPVEHYIELLRYIKERYEGQYWHALPREVAGFWFERCNHLEELTIPFFRSTIVSETKIEQICGSRA
ncbi:MAG: polysaccharide deacetylase family protein [Sedimentisphaerales bacterium]|nr:polysaccharide deacetylase family protein [Sedimentisphaerales bacterium]